MIAVNVLLAKGAFTPDGHSWYFPFAIIIKLLGHSKKPAEEDEVIVCIFHPLLTALRDPVPVLFQMKSSFMQIDLVTMSELILPGPPIFALDGFFFHNAWGVISLTAVNSGHWLWLCLWISLNFNAFWKHWCAIFFKQEASFTDPLPGCC